MRAVLDHLGVGGKGEEARMLPPPYTLKLTTCKNIIASSMRNSRDRVIPSPSTTRKQTFYLWVFWLSYCYVTNYPKLGDLKTTTIFIIPYDSAAQEFGQWGILSLLPTMSAGLEWVRWLLHVCFWFSDRGLAPEALFTWVWLISMDRQRRGRKEAKSHLSGSAGSLPGFKALSSVISCLDLPLRDGATEYVFANGETEPQVQLWGLAQGKCLLRLDIEQLPLHLWSQVLKPRMLTTVEWRRAGWKGLNGFMCYQGWPSSLVFLHIVSDCPPLHMDRPTA